MKIKLLGFTIFLLLFAFFASGNANAAKKFRGAKPRSGVVVKQHHRTSLNKTNKTKGTALGSQTRKKVKVSPHKTPRKK